MPDLVKKLVTMQRVNASNQAEIFYPRTLASQVFYDEANNKTVADHITDTAQIHLTATERTRLTATDTAGGYVTLDSNGFIPVSKLNPSVLAITVEFANVAAIDATKVETGQLIMVVDASADTTVNSGWAIYRKRVDTDPASLDYTKVNGNDAGWQKIAEKESIDVSLEWANINGKPSSAVADIDDAVSKKHDHANKAVLDLITYDTTNSALLYNSTETIAFMSRVPAVIVADAATPPTYANLKENDIVYIVTGTVA
jgi:hypothetical protein